MKKTCTSGLVANVSIHLKGTDHGSYLIDVLSTCNKTKRLITTQLCQMCQMYCVAPPSQLGLHLGASQLKEPWGASTHLHPHHQHPRHGSICILLFCLYFFVVAFFFEDIKSGRNCALRSNGVNQWAPERAFSGAEVDLWRSQRRHQGSIVLAVQQSCQP